MTHLLSGINNKFSQSEMKIRVVFTALTHQLPVVALVVAGLLLDHVDTPALADHDRVVEEEHEDDAQCLHDEGVVLWAGCVWPY